MEEELQIMVIEAQSTDVTSNIRYINQSSIDRISVDVGISFESKNIRQNRWRFSQEEHIHTLSSG